MMLLQRSLWTRLCVLCLILSSCAPTGSSLTASRGWLSDIRKKPIQKAGIPTTPKIAPITPLPVKWDFQLPKLTADPQPIFSPSLFWHPEPCETLRDSLIMFAKQYLGKPYRSAGKGPKAFDCSGFTSFVMRRFGYYLPPSSKSQAVFGTPISIEEARKGDLLFFGNKDRKGRFYVNHAALVISETGEELAMIHAARHGITIDQASNENWRSYYGKRLIGARRIIHEGVLPDLLEIERRDLAFSSADTVHRTSGVN